METEMDNENENENEGMSTGKKVVAGAAVGVAVPAAVGVAKKLFGHDGDDEQAGGVGAPGPGPFDLGRSEAFRVHGEVDRLRHGGKALGASPLRVILRRFAGPSAPQRAWESPFSDAARRPTRRRKGRRNFPQTT